MKAAATLHRRRATSQSAPTTRKKSMASRVSSATPATVPAANTLRYMSALVSDWESGIEQRWAPPVILLAAFNLDFLCIHPFRDGNLRHIEITERLLHHLRVTHGLVSLTLSELESQLAGACLKLSGDTALDEFLGSRNIKLSLPRTGRDIIDLIPQNLIMVYRKIRKGHTLF